MKIERIRAGIAAASLGGAVLLAGAAQAVTVVGAASITVKSALPSYLQVAELLAFNFGGTNVALASNGATAAALSQFFPSTFPQGGPAEAIDGFYPANYDYTYVSGTPGVYHSGGTGSDEYLTVTFAAPVTLSSIAIYGRGDCCSDRDRYDVTVRNAAGGVIHTFQLDARATGSASASFDAPETVVPEPASWAMMILGFGSAGSILRRRRAATPV